MSSILKALEKVEESRNPKRKVSSIGVARAENRRPAWVLPVAVVGGAAVAALVTFTAMGGFSTPLQPAKVQLAPKPAPVLSVQQPLVNATAVAQPAPMPRAEPAIRPEQHPEAAATLAPAEKPHRQAAVTLKPAKKPHRQAAVTSAPAKKPHPVPAAVKRRVLAPPAPVRKAPPQIAETPQPAAQPLRAKSAEGIRVLGIAWQKDSQSSAAIVNGHPVVEGGIVDGCKVEEIFQDKVRFSGPNGKFEVPLGASE